MYQGRRTELADLLDQLVQGAISPGDFRTALAVQYGNLDDELIVIALDEAADYLRAFERLSLFGRPLPPDPEEVAEREQSLRIIARALREQWSAKELNRQLRTT